LSTEFAGGSHAAQMDSMYRYQRHIYDLTRKYYLFGRDRMILGLRAPDHARILDIGCGTGRNLALVHKHYPKTLLHGVDISREMLQTAKTNLAALPQSPTLLTADATSFKAADFGVPGFDRIIISYALSMIPDWEDAVAAALHALAPEGSLHIVDFGQQERLPRLFRRALQGWLARFHVTPRADLAEVLERHLEQANADMIFEEIGRGYAWHAVIRKRA
jgi:S-adenosylmethionine-diacylgycerolhomoserine-N-methlytransferase